ncbi:DUF1669 domain-containing protein [Rhodocytophaga rosea]|uniref:phospholipase D n=1 Tax=Rhodocytophaga rosea TaxID=2704465 RepID=A0A6C0GUE2_9BACT|nr:phospholipase D-like domain-containing protein [Rhodocytophaga rosea]QHT71173.1 DUF1669 domain-containing protein [Rhodocytophaga rosea]
MIEPHFGDIRNIILEQLNKAEFDIYVAVAWITDKYLLDILLSKAANGLIVQIILVKDEINLNNGFDYGNFLETGGQIFWNDHHHKFCVIDRKIVITGSYNWTYAANMRVKRENIIVIKGEEALIENYSREFKTLLKNSNKCGTDIPKYTTTTQASRFSKAYFEEIFEYEDGSRRALIIEKDLLGNELRQVWVDVNKTAKTGVAVNLDEYMIEYRKDSDGKMRYWIVGLK